MSLIIGSDRRASARVAVQIEAQVIAPQRATIVDLSAGGCQVRLARPLDLPQRFVIEFNDTVYLCEPRWTNGVNAGLQFIDVLSRAQRKELAGCWAAPRK